MEITELIQKLVDLATNEDEERDHIVADNLLLEFINNRDVSLAFKAIKRWYS